MAIDLLEYRKMCQMCSALEYKNIPDEYLVVYNGIKYYPFSREEKFIKGKPVNVPILHDVKSNCEVKAILERIEKIENDC